VSANEHLEALKQLQEAVKDYPQAHLALATEMAASGRLPDAVRSRRSSSVCCPTTPRCRPRAI